MTARILLCALCTLAAGCLEGTFRIQQAPRFTSCRLSLPPAGQHYPAGSWSVVAPGPGRCGGGSNVSGMDVLYEYDKKGTAKPTEVAFQQIDVVGDLFVPGQKCGDTDHTILLHFVEYFHLSAYDVQARSFCCEDVMQENTSGQVGIVDLNDLPPDIQSAIPPIAPGENAEFVTPALTAAQRQTLAGQIQRDKVIYWQHRYEYDGCHPQSPATTCGDSHCLDVSWSDSNGQGRDQEHGRGQ